MGVRSRGWIMERTEGRWPSLDPTKNSLRTEERAFSLRPVGPQAGQGAERAGPAGWAPHLRFSGALMGSAGKGANSAFLASVPPSGPCLTRTRERFQKDTVVSPVGRGPGGAG